jgi:hypothetical protein
MIVFSEGLVVRMKDSTALRESKLVRLYARAGFLAEFLSDPPL